MSKRAEEFALEKYPKRIVRLYGPLMLYDGKDEPLEVDDNLIPRKACVQGYEQAEKDLALTWEDIRRIFEEVNIIEVEFFRENKRRLTDNELYKEVLRRFNEYKNK